MKPAVTSEEIFPILYVNSEREAFLDVKKTKTFTEISVNFSSNFNDQQDKSDTQEMP